jgi:hypothetical protein
MGIHLLLEIIIATGVVKFDTGRRGRTISVIDGE